MKLHNTHNNVDVGGATSTTAYSVEVGPQLFKIMSDKLYSNKIAAPIRELCTNAYDAQVAVGINKPFKVKLPSVLDPVFYVRDYGKGLSPDEMVAVYTRYGKSTKTDTNTQTGCLGLGSKSPFAYSGGDAYTICSYQNGVIRTYAAYINKEGTPTLSLMTEGSTTEDDGLQVIFPVRDADLDNFVNEAGCVLGVFDDVAYTVIGNARFKAAKPSYMLNGCISDCIKYALLANEWQHSSTASRVIMGNVAYPLVAEAIFADINSADRSPIRHLLNNGIDLFVPIGSVEMVPSREALSFNEHTRSFLFKTLTAVHKDIINIVNTTVLNKFDDVPSIFQARLQIAKFSNSIWNSLGIKPPTTWRGSPISSTISLNETNYGTLPADTLYIAKATSWRRLKFSNMSRIYGQIRVSPELMVFHADLKRGNESRVIQFLKTKNDSAIRSRADEVYIVGGDKAVEFLQGSGLDEIAIKVSTLPPVVRDKTAAGTTQRVSYKNQVFKLVVKHQYDPYKREAWEKMPTVSVSDVKPFVALKSWRPYPYVALNLFKVRESIRLLDDSSMEIYGVLNSDVDKLKTSDNWISLKDYADRLINKLRDKYDPAMYAWQALEDLPMPEYIMAAFRGESLPAGCPGVLSRPFKAVRSLSNGLSMDNIVAYSDMLRVFDYKQSRPDKIDEIVKELGKVVDDLSVKFPALHNRTGVLGGVSKLDVVAAYVKGCLAGVEQNT